MAKPSLKKNPQQEAYQEISYLDTYNLSFYRGLTYNPDTLVGRRGLKAYDKMREDDQVKAVMLFKKHSVLSSGWKIEPATDAPQDEEIATFVEDILLRLKGNVKDNILEILTAMDYGYSITEKVWEVIEEGKHQGKIGIKALKTRKPHYFLIGQDDFGNLTTLVQQMPMQPDSELPINKFIIYAYQKEFENYYGVSDLRACYRNFFSKDTIIKYWNIFLERFAMPTAIGKYDPNIGKPLQDKIKTIVERIQVKMGIILPKGVDVELLEAKRTGKEVYSPALEYHDKSIARSLLMPDSLGITGDSGEGSRAKSQVHFDMFLFILEKIRSDIEETVMMEQLIRELVDYNFVVQEYPKFKFLPITKDNIELIFTLWNNAIQSGSVVNTIEDEALLRKLLNFPVREKSEDEKEEEKPEIEEPEIEEPEEEDEEGEEDKKEFKSYRLPDEIEHKVDYNRIERSWDKAVAQTADSLIQILTKQKAAIWKKIKTEIDNNSLNIKFINALELGFMPGIQKNIGGFMRTIYNLGKRDLSREVDTIDFAVDPILPEEAIKYLEGKKIFVSGLMKDELTNEVKTALVSFLKSGGTLSEFQATMDEIYKPWLGDLTAIKDGKVLTPHRIETVLRTNLSEAYNEGRKAMAADPDLKDYIMGWEYSEILDSRTTPISLYIDGKKIKKDDADLPRLSYPLPYNDRGLFVPITSDDLPVTWITASEKARLKSMIGKFK